jgi:uncharacterized protein YvpB
MSTAVQRRSAARRRAVLRRRTLALGILAVLALVATLLLLRPGGAPPRSGQPGFVTLNFGGRVLARRPVAGLRRPEAAAALLGLVPDGRTAHRGPTVIELRTERAALSRELARAARRGGGVVAVPERPTAARTRVPLVQQALRDNCETASLSMILAFRAKAVGQLALQSEVAHSKPLDPTVSPEGSEVWGDPNRGFVGRADGGGPAGGYGVYQRPIQALARRHGVDLRNLTGASPQAVYRALLDGHPVLAWVALSNGPFAIWQTPAGRTVRANYGEHAIVLTGVGPRTVSLNDPLSGRRLTWAKPDFERMWTALGRRALST